jgi:hypothetical protein
MGRMRKCRSGAIVQGPVGVVCIAMLVVGTNGTEQVPADQNQRSAELKPHTKPATAPTDKYVCPQCIFDMV